MQAKNIGEILKVNFILPLWAVITAGAIIILASYFLLPQYQDHIRFIAAILGGASAIYSAYYIGVSLRLSISRDKMNKSFEILSLLNRPEFSMVRRFVDKETDGNSNISPEDYYSKIVENQELLNSVTVVLGLLEDASLSIQYGYVDEQILHQQLAHMVDWYFTRLRTYIDFLRKERNRKTIYIEFEKMFNSWKEMKQLSNGESFTKKQN